MTPAAWSPSLTPWTRLVHVTGMFQTGRQFINVEQLCCRERPGGLLGKFPHRAGTGRPSPLSGWFPPDEVRDVVAGAGVPCVEVRSSDLRNLETRGRRSVAGNALRLGADGGQAPVVAESVEVSAQEPLGGGGVTAGCVVSQHARQEFQGARRCRGRQGVGKVPRAVAPVRRTS